MGKNKFLKRTTEANLLAFGLIEPANWTATLTTERLLTHEKITKMIRITGAKQVAT